MNDAKVAYVVTRFPTVTETFILREMHALERQGLHLELYVPIPERGGTMHPDAAPYVARMRTARSSSAAVVLANAAWLVRRPAAYLGLLTTTLWQLRRSAHLLVRALVLIPQAGWMARDMQHRGIAHVHAHFATHGAFLAYAIHRLTGIGYSFTAHAHDIYVRRAMLREKIDRACFVVTISERNAVLLRDEGGAAAAEKVHVVRCGVARALPDQRRHRSGDGFSVLTVASLRDYKGIPDLVAACALARRAIPKLRWKLVGDGPDRHVVEELVRQHGVGDVLELCGSQPEDEVARRLQQADAFVLTSVVLPDGRAEGIPVALMEALAAGLPVVATDISGVPELVIDGRTGHLVPERAPEAVARALVAIAQDPESAAALGTAGAAWVRQEFDLERNVSRMRALLTSAVEASTAAAHATPTEQRR